MIEGFRFPTFLIKKKNPSKGEKENKEAEGKDRTLHFFGKKK